MRRTVNEGTIAPDVVQTPEYQRGYRDGLRDRQARYRSRSADGILGALLALALLGGVGYFAYNYSQTGQWMPQTDLTNQLPNFSPAPTR